MVPEHSLGKYNMKLRRFDVAMIAFVSAMLRVSDAREDE
jgi:hypothetical protein